MESAISAKRILLISLLFATSTQAAEIIPQLPSFFDAGRISRELRATEIPTPTKVTPLITDTATTHQPVTGGSQLSFKLTHVIITGNTVFSTRSLECFFASAINKTISLAELQNRVKDISEKYRAAGYILSRAILPPQEIKNGIVRVKVLEGFISKVTVEGKPGLARCVVADYGRVVLRSRPLQIKVLERQVLLANDIPGISVQAVITPSKTIPASADLTLIANRKIFNGYVTYDDFSTRFLGPLETSWGGSVNSVFLPGDNNALHFATSSQTKELQFAEFVHTQAVGNQGSSFILGSNYTETRPGFSLEPLEIIGRSFSVYSSLTYPIIRSRTQNLFIRGSGNYQNVTSTILSVPFYQDRFRSLGIGGFYSTDDCLKGFNTLDFNVSHGFDILGANKHFFQSRPKGQSQYTKLIFNASRTQPFATRFSLYTALQSQYSFEPLLATEQFGYGGPLYGRGYGPSEIVGDRGLGGKVELRVDTAPELCLLKAVQYYVFYDAGIIWNIDKHNLPPEQSATSTGLGARFNFLPQLTGDLYIAKPLSRKAITLTPFGQNFYQARGFFQIALQF